jgi:membrane protease YdiL (CAAX protease family)
MMDSVVSEGKGDQSAKRKVLIQAVIALLVFCGLSLLSRFVAPVYLFVVGSGLFLPLVWGVFTKDWGTMGFTRRNLGKAVLWGLAAGLLCYLYTVLTAAKTPPPPMLGLQLAIGIPIALLVISPFQEFFFRGWLQPRFERAFGKWTGLSVTALCFALWHYFPAFETSPTGAAIRLTSVYGFLTLLGLGLVWGYVFQRTGNIIAPWVAHTLAIVGLITTGAMVLVQYTP